MSKYNLMDNEQPGFFDQYQNAEKKSDSRQEIPFFSAQPVEMSWRRGL